MGSPGGPPGDASTYCLVPIALRGHVVQRPLQAGPPLGLALEHIGLALRLQRVQGQGLPRSLRPALHHSSQPVEAHPGEAPPSRPGGKQGRASGVA